MPAIVTDQFRILNASNFVENVTNGSNSYYVFIGLANPKTPTENTKLFGRDWNWNSSGQTPAPIDNFSNNYHVGDTILYGKKITADNIRRVIRKVTWEPNTRYDFYRDDVSYENKSTAYITRLDSQANSNNQGKTLESMRNQLNTYLGDVDNVVQVISDQRPEYENKSRGFLKIRKPNQAIILRNPNQELEFQKDNSYLTDGFTITMWVRFVGKTGRGTLFNFGNPTATESPYGFRLETITRKNIEGQYKIIVRLVLYDHINGKLYDSSFGAETRNRYNTIENNEPAFPVRDFNTRNARFNDYVKVPTTDLNEWFFICATYDPTINEEGSFEEPYYSLFRRNKQFWLNHIEPEFSAAGMEDSLVANSGFGARCKVEMISRSDLLRARGFKVGSLEYDV